MSRYISIRGWLECDDDIYTNVIKFINKYEIEYEKFYLSEEQIKYYQKGWVFNNYQIGWRRYIFYGADVKSYNTAFFTKQLEDICQLKFNIDGKFFLDEESGESSVCIEIKDDTIVETHNKLE